MTDSGRTRYRIRCGYFGDWEHLPELLAIFYYKCAETVISYLPHWGNFHQVRTRSTYSFLTYNVSTAARLGKVFYNG